MSSATRLRIIVIAKEPVPGLVKTRLTPPLTPDEAAGLARVSLEQTLATVARVPRVDRVLLLQGAADRLPTDGFTVVPQVGGGLDERIAAAFDASPGPALLIGMDTPQVPRRLLESVGEDRESAAWFGAATDGGFWALGLREPDGDLVRGVPMSRADTGAQQLARLRRAGLETRILPVLTDVDRVEDALAVAAEAPGSAFGAAVDALRLGDRVAAGSGGRGLPGRGVPD